MGEERVAEGEGKRGADNLGVATVDIHGVGPDCHLAARARRRDLGGKEEEGKEEKKTGGGR